MDEVKIPEIFSFSWVKLILAIFLAIVGFSLSTYVKNMPCWPDFCFDRLTMIFLIILDLPGQVFPYLLSVYLLFLTEVLLNLIFLYYLVSLIYFVIKKIRV